MSQNAKRGRLWLVKTGALSWSQGPPQASGSSRPSSWPRTKGETPQGGNTNLRPPILYIYKLVLKGRHHLVTVRCTAEAFGGNRWLDEDEDELMMLLMMRWWWSLPNRTFHAHLWAVFQERCTLVVHGRDPAKVDALVKRLQRYTKVHGYAGPWDCLEWNLEAALFAQSVNF